MGDKVQLVDKMKDLKALNAELIELCAQQKPAFIGFEIEKIKTEMEKNVLRNGINSLDVNVLQEWTKMHRVLDSWGSYYKAADYSTKFVDRTPGVVVITENISHIKSLINNINKLKDELAFIVREGRDQYERHEFIHKAFNGIMTEQVYRHIHYFDKEVTNIWFNWASRPVPKSYKIKDALKMLDKKMSRPKYLISTKEWESMIERIKIEVKSGGFDSIQQMKEFRVLPTIEMQYFEGIGVKKRKKSNATTPILLFGQKENTLPKYSTLNPFINKNPDKQMRIGANKTLINPYLKLVGVKKIEK